MWNPSRAGFVALSWLLVSQPVNAAMLSVDASVRRNR
mgnify:CR=1 FL=1